MPRCTVKIVRENIREGGVSRTQFRYGSRLFNRGSDKWMAELEAVRAKDSQAGIDNSIPVTLGNRCASHRLRRLLQLAGFPIFQSSGEK
jgi:hypothetical protein